MNVLVTGATGFLGAHVTAALVERGHHVCALVRPGRPHEHIAHPAVVFAEGDLLDPPSLQAACDGAEGVVNCAAVQGYWSRLAEAQRRVNVAGVAHLLEAARAARVARVVHVSSVAAVGATRDGAPLDESARWNLGPLRVTYADTKRRGEELALAAARGGLPVVVVNPSAMFGPRLDGGPPSGLLRGVAAGTLRWTPPGGISVTDVEDVARAVAVALERGAAGERYLLAGHNLTWAALYAAIAHVTGGRAPHRRLSTLAVRGLAAGTRGLDLLHLARPPWTPETWRSLGWYSWFDSAKARRELDYAVRPLEAIVRHALVPHAAAAAAPG